MMVAGYWQGLEERVREEFAKSGVEPGQIGFTHAVRMQYYGQLNDIEIVSPHDQIEEASQVDDLIDVFEEAYGKVFARSARSPELGYLITHAIVLGSVEVENAGAPRRGGGIRRPADQGRPPGLVAAPGLTEAEPAQTDVYELSEISAGNQIEGPAIIESVATTFAIPPGRSARLDRHQIFHLSRSSG